jgi:hypothetical protein
MPESIERCEKHAPPWKPTFPLIEENFSGVKRNRLPQRVMAHAFFALRLWGFFDAARYTFPQ